VSGFARYRAFPGYNIGWLEERWDADFQLQWLRDAKRDLRAYFDTFYLDDTNEPLETLPPPAPVSRKHEASHYEQWVKSKQRRVIYTSGDRELDRYLRLEPVETDDPVQWWIDHKSSFPRLSRLALDIFAIPAMATDCERAFSLAKLSETSQRQAMQPDTLDELQCSKNWIRHGGITLGGVIIPTEQQNEDELVPG
jgi:hypothetical protein